MPKPPKSHIPAWLHPPIYLAVRTALAAAVSGDLHARCALASDIGGLIARLPPIRVGVRRAERNIRQAFPDWDEARVHDTAVSSYRHMVRLGVEFAYAPRLLNDDGWPRHLALGNVAQGVRTLLQAGPCVLITGHCGNWELLGYTMALFGFPMHALYRPLDMPVLDRWMFRTRRRRGLTLIDKFGALKQMAGIVRDGAPVGFVADQNGGDRGIFVPYFGRLTSTYKSIGLLAMQFNATVICGLARRRRPGEAPPDPGSLGYSIEVPDVIHPADWQNQPDPLFYLTARYRRALETMIRSAPEQYLWMHRTWKSRPRHERSGKPFPPSLLEKMRLLPWMTDADVERVVDQSARDARQMAETGLDRIP